MIEDGHRVAVAATKPSTSSPAGSHRFFRLPASGFLRVARRVVGGRVSEAAQIPTGALALRRIAASFRPDVIHVHHLNWYAGACALAGLSPLVVSVWGAINPRDETSAHPVRRWRLHRAILGRCAAAVVEFPGGVEPCRKLGGPALQVEVIPLGTNTRAFAPAATGSSDERRRALGISPDDFVFLSPRGISEIYRHERILEAFARARSRMRRRGVLVFVRLPRDTPRAVRRHEAKLRGRAKTLGIERDVRWLPAQRYDEMPALYALCDAVVNFPAPDAFPATLAEAAASERPIVTAGLPSYRGTFLESFATWVDPARPEALEDALAAVGSAASHRERLIAARRAVERDCEESVARKRLAALYRELAQPASGETTAGR